MILKPDDRVQLGDIIHFPNGDTHIVTGLLAGFPVKEIAIYIERSAPIQEHCTCENVTMSRMLNGRCFRCGQLVVR